MDLGVKNQFLTSMMTLQMSRTNVIELKRRSRTDLVSIYFIMNDDCLEVRKYQVPVIIHILM